MRDHALRGSARDAFAILTSDERRAAAAVIAELKDARVPLVGPRDFSITHGAATIMGRAVPGTDLAVCYVPAGEAFFVVNIVRRR